MIGSLLASTFTGSYLLLRWSHCRQQRVARLVLAMSLDFILGMVASQLLLSSYPPKRLTSLTLTAMEGVVGNLKVLITWLMGAPVGLKLNSVLSGALGKFFLYHIHLWVTFLYLAMPYVSEALVLVLNLSRFGGLCLQLSVAQDALNVVTFHIHCFYAYARRLFLSQTSGLQSLWRLFRGQKYNPLRNRIDSLDTVSVDQLFVGTLGFTILLFLYPTTFMYFAVFKVLEVCLIAINTILSALMKAIATLGLSGIPYAQEEELVKKPYFHQY